MKKISLIGFRGTRQEDKPEFKDENPLIWTGHVGIMFEGDERIFGFHPTEEAIAANDGIRAVLKKLKDERESFSLDGRVYDDRKLFVRAAELADQRTPIRFDNQGEPIEHLEVWRYEFEIDEVEFNNIRNMTITYFEQATIFPYGFPRIDAPWDNCATFPKKVGIRVPDVVPPGQLEKYIPKLKEQGKRWRPS